MSLSFVKKSGRGGSHSNKDVCITWSDKCGTSTYDKKAAYFTFKNGSWDKISPINNCFVYAISGSRIYFKDSDIKDGFWMTENKSHIKKEGDFSNSRYTSFTGRKHKDLIDFCEKHAGDFDLLYDDKNELYFIETKFLFYSKNGRQY